jgi:hypothetical protein
MVRVRTEEGTISLRRNFRFDSLSGGFSVIAFGDRVIDLHNDYDLERFGTDRSGSEVELTFRRNRHAFKPEGLPARVALRCTGNVKVAFNNLNEIAAPLNDEGIEIAFFDEDCDWASFTDEQIAARQEPLGLDIRFINGLVVRIYCEEVTFQT